jgi:hypothetical protein
MKLDVTEDFYYLTVSKNLSIQSRDFSAKKIIFPVVKSWSISTRQKITEKKSI